MPLSREDETDDPLGEADVIFRLPKNPLLKALLRRLVGFLTGIGLANLISVGTGVEGADDGVVILDDAIEEIVSFDPRPRWLSEGQSLSWGCVVLESMQSGETDLGIGSSTKYGPDERYPLFSK